MSGRIALIFGIAFNVLVLIFGILLWAEKPRLGGDEIATVGVLVGLSGLINLCLVAFPRSDDPDSLAVLWIRVRKKRLRQELAEREPSP